MSNADVKVKLLDLYRSTQQALAEALSTLPPNGEADHPRGPAWTAYVKLRQLEQTLRVALELFS